MKTMWERCLRWSDRINAPFYRHKHRLLLYVALSQTVIVTVGLLNLFRPQPPLTSVCQQQYDGTTICYCQR
jgi:hypothetical protein